MHRFCAPFSAEAKSQASPAILEADLLIAHAMLLCIYKK
jgi:hypothetical protein